MACLFFSHLIKFAWPTQWLSCGGIWQKVFLVSSQPVWPAAAAAVGMVGFQGDNAMRRACMNQKSPLDPRDPKLTIIRSNWKAALPSHLSAITTRSKGICHVTVKTCALCLPPIWLMGWGKCWCAGWPWWTGFDVLLLSYISVMRGGAQHAVVHADRGCVCDGSSAGGGGGRTRTGVFEKQGRVQLWQVAAAGWRWLLGGGATELEMFLRGDCSPHRRIDGRPWSISPLSWLDRPGEWH